MKRIILFLLLATCAGFAAETTWLTSLPEALKKAEAEKKAVLVNFTGSDWCIWCKKLKREVFNEPEFDAFVEQNLVVVEIDFPRSRPLPQAAQAANEELAAKYQVKGFPTVLVLNAAGKKLAETGYRDGGAEGYVKHLAGISGFAWRKSAAVPKAPAREPVASTPTAPAQDRYDELVLRGISGRAIKTALINNQTLSEGATGPVKLGDKQVQIECKEIRENSVLVQVEGETEPRELKLKSAQTK